MGLIDQRQALNRGLRRDIEHFETGLNQARHEAAARATERSRNRFTRLLSGRPTTDPRRGRPTTGGTFASYINWVPDSRGGVQADIVSLQAAAPYWLVQEVGTERGRSARALRAGPEGPEVAFVAGVPRQAGRVIPSGLVWSGSNPPNDQIVRGPWRQPITIRREITGKHYLRTGGKLGFRHYERVLEKAFFSAFGHHPKR